MAAGPLEHGVVGVNATPLGDGPERVSRAWTTRFTAAWLGFWMGNLVPLNLLLLNQLKDIDPHSKVRDFAVVNGVSGFIALVVLPVCGALCDRTRSRFGRRRVWMAAGSVLFAIGLLLTGFQHSWPGLVVWWSFSQLGLSAMTAGLTAVVADSVPYEQRGMISSAIFGPQALGVVIGIGLVTAFDLTSLEGYVVIAILMLALVFPFVRHYEEVPAEATQSVTLGEIVGSFRIDYRAHPDFAWAFGGRLLVNLANSLGVCYLLYFLQDAIKVKDPDATLLALTVVYLIAGLILTYIGGILSDRSGRRRVFVFYAAALQGLAGFVLAAFPTVGWCYLGAVLLGGGFGCYMAVDQALITDVLPDAESRAKDLGLMNIGTIVPPAIAPALAGALVTSEGAGYPRLFALAGVLGVLGAACVYRIKSVR